MATPTTTQTTGTSSSPPPRRRAWRTSAIAGIGGLGALMLALSPLQFGPAPRPGGVGTTPHEQVWNGRFEEAAESLAAGWGSAGAGYRFARGEGIDGSHSICCTNQDRRSETGAFQTLTFDQSRLLPIRVSGWSKARDVAGVPDDDYALHASVEYQDGSRLEKVAVDFDCGTHDWQKREMLLPALKPVKTVVLHCLFRNHSGQVWFDNISVEELRPNPGTVLLQGAPWTPFSSRDRRSASSRVLETGDGLRATVRDHRIVSLAIQGHETATEDPSGFVVRDAAESGPWQPFENSACKELRLALDARWQAGKDHLSIEGELLDLTGKDRAVSLSFLVPLDALGWSWGEDARRSRTIESPGEYVNAVPLPCGATASLSKYPVAAVYSPRTGLALAADPDLAVQYRVGYHAEIRKLFISYDFGLLPDSVDLPSRARFRFVLYRFDPAEGFRGALQGLYAIFPSSFARRCLDSGTWLPFASPGTIPDWEDFGFAFREVARGESPEGPPELRTFRYTEPLGWWTLLPERFPRSREDVLSSLRDGVVDPVELPREAVHASVMKTSEGLPRFTFQKQPWCDGVLWSMNPNPRLPGRATAALLWWNPDVKDRHYRNGARSDGEFVDSAEGYAMAELDFDRVHLRYSTAPPSFSSGSRVPVLYKGQMIHEYAKSTARELRELGKFTFGNGTPRRYSFLAPSFDILGAEVDWFVDGRFAPPDDAELCYWRAMAFQKPYCILLNTRLTQLSPAGLERYFQRCLFYGMFPSLFSHDAQNDSYWSNPALYERDRPLFRKYIPLIRRTAIAGWQPVTAVRCDAPEVLVERFGPDGGGVRYLALLNTGATDQEATLTLGRAGNRPGLPVESKELITAATYPIRSGAIRIAVPAGATRLLELREPVQK